MLVAGSNRRVFGIDAHAGAVVTGYAADGRQLVNRAREEAQSYRDTYGGPIVPSILSNRMALYVHYFTMYGSLRPFGCSALVAAYDTDLKTPELYMIEPSGAAFRYFGCAAGKGANAAKTELEKLLNKAGTEGITCRQAVKELARILQVIRDPAKDKPLETEMGWLCAESGYKHAHVPEDLVKEAEAAALAEVGAIAVPVEEASAGVAEEKAMDVEV